MTIELQGVVDAALAGVEDAVVLQADFDLYYETMQAEYIVTVQVARSLLRHHRSNQFLGDVKLHIEHPTEKTVRETVAGKPFNTPNMADVARRREIIKCALERICLDDDFRDGKVDILVVASPDVSSDEGGAYVVELKGENPSTAEIEKEVVRIGKLLKLSKNTSRLHFGLIVFVWRGVGRKTTQEKRETDLRKAMEGVCSRVDVAIEINSERIATTNDEQDGPPEVVGFCVVVKRNERHAEFT